MTCGFRIARLGWVLPFAWLVGCTSAVPPGAIGGAGGAGTGGSPSGGASGAAGADTGSGQLGASCENNTDCESSICVRNRCAVACRTPTDCPPTPEWTCALSPGHGTLCQCSSTGVELCDGRDNDCDGKLDNGASCPGELACQSGACSCPSGSQCGTTCVDLDGDPFNCGDCDVICPAGAACVAGTCECPTGETLCDDRCVDLSTDNAHCGACGQACSALEHCVGGKKTCAHTLCSGICVDTDEDPLNCGACGHDCAGGACIDALCQPIELIPGEIATGVAIDSTHLYWANLLAREIRSATLDGKNVTTVATGHDSPLAFTPIVVNATGVYWEYNMGVIFGAPFGSIPCAATPLPTKCVLVVNEYANSDNINDIAVDDTNVYWADYLGSIKRSNLDGSGQVTLVADRADPRGLRVQGGQLYWADTAASYSGLPGLMRMNSDGSNLTTLWSGPLDGTFSIHGTDLFSSSGQTIRRISLSNGSIDAVSRGSMSRVLTDDKWIYWWGSDEQFWGEAMFKAPLTGGPSVRISAEGGAMVQDARFIYFTTYYTERLMRLAK